MKGYNENSNIPNLKSKVGQSGHADLVDENVPVKFDTSLSSNIKGVCSAKVLEEKDGKKTIDKSSIQIALNPNNHEDEADVAGTLGHEFKHAEQFRTEVIEDSKKREYEDAADKVGNSVKSYTRSSQGRVRAAA